MKIFFACVWSVAVLAAAPVVVRAQCGATGCQGSSPQWAASSPGGYRWVNRADTPDQTYLFHGNRQVGGYSFTSGFYRPYNGSSWGSPAAAPITPPFDDSGFVGDRVFFGAEIGKLSGHNRYMVSGHDVPKSEAESYLDGTVPRDWDAPHVTAVVRDAAARKKLDADFAAAAASDKSLSQVRWQAYDFSAPVNRLIMAPFKLDLDRTFQSAGQMLIAQTAQKANQDFVPALRSYGAVGPREIIEAVRKVTPDDPNRPLAPTLPNLANLSLEAWVGIAALAVLALVLMRGRNP